MTVVLLILVVLGLLTLCVGTIWFVVNAFRVSLLWGVLVCILTPAWFRFAFRHWDMAKLPVITIAVGLAVAFGSEQLLPDKDRFLMAEVTKSIRPRKHAEIPKEDAAVEAEAPLSTVDKEAELKSKLAALAQKESVLRARKSALNPKNQKEALALDAEIKAYNAELAPVLQEMHERGLQTAAR